MDIHEIFNLIEGSVSGKFTGAGIVFCTKAGDVLILKKPGRLWGMPGGKPIFGEFPEETAIREAREETGITANKLSKPLIIYYKNRKYYSYISILDTKPNVHLSNEHKKYKWVYYRDIKEGKLLSPFRETLPRYIKAIEDIINN
jgi:8-oxo-dGTP pyrophosphatase MutT (NUDIX family)